MSDHPLVNHEKVVVTPHTAGITRQSFDTLGCSVADNVERLKKGEPLQELVHHRTFMLGQKFGFQIIYSLLYAIIILKETTVKTVERSTFTQLHLCKVLIGMMK